MCHLPSRTVLVGDDTVQLTKHPLGKQEQEKKNHREATKEEEQEEDEKANKNENTNKKTTMIKLWW